MLVAYARKGFLQPKDDQDGGFSELALQKGSQRRL